VKITVFNGSPKGKQSATHVMVKAFTKGATEAGAEMENIFLVRKKIKHCLGCFHCWIKTPGQCVHKDDMADLLQVFIRSDVVVFATPLYVDNVTGIMKNFMDRLIPLADPHFEKSEQGEYRHVSRFENRHKIAVLSNCGFPEQSHFQVLRLLFRRIARNFQAELVAEIYRGGGPLLQDPPPILRDIIADYLKLLEEAGREVVIHGKVSGALTDRLEEPLIPHDLYIEGANRDYWDIELAKLQSR
jgi:multimeric flavodoxin WrbA